MEELALSKRKCPLYFRRDNNREIRENREQKGSVPRKPILHSQKVLPKGICPKSWATGTFPLSSILPPVVAQNLRKFYDLFLLVRTVRVVRGS